VGDDAAGARGVDQLGPGVAGTRGEGHEAACVHLVGAGPELDVDDG
jgi:hypothetical protein